ncbi:hypothetical protein POM88_021764 [Heracleum sosnowskyi]|uniref:Uncharacterized protein n=1 Tax=Heracleum sosnowskyi TaxID=360622 RepID=A0AAD8IFH1_9APIA|nr:hypothetical protein POM88_021764 [Heracleum sosnowskyi]
MLVPSTEHVDSIPQPLEGPLPMEGDGSVLIWKDYSVRSKQKLVTAFSSIPGHKPSVRCVNAVVDWQQQSGYLYASGEVSSTMVWDLDKEQLVNTIPLDAECSVSALDLLNIDLSQLINLNICMNSDTNALRSDVYSASKTEDLKASEINSLLELKGKIELFIPKELKYAYPRIAAMAVVQVLMPIALCSYTMVFPEQLLMGVGYGSHWRVFCGANMGNAADSPSWFDEIMHICDVEKVCEVAMLWWSLWKACNNLVWHQKCSTIGAVVHQL